MWTKMMLVVLFLAFLTGVQGSWDDDTCSTEFDQCSVLYNNLANEGDCDSFLQTMNCYQAIVDHGCFLLSFQSFGSIMTIRNDYYCAQDCSNYSTYDECVNPSTSAPTPDTSTPSSPPIPSCSYTPSLASVQPELSQGPPTLSHSPPSQECTLPSHATLYQQHCSIFSLSHLRPFDDRQQYSGLQTCSLLGNVYLLKHNALSVSVRGEARAGTVGIYTHITEVNVTFRQYKDCFPLPVHYRATVNELPSPETSQLQQGLSIVVNNTVATLIAPWINTTIIIRRSSGGYLSISLQVPYTISRERDVSGLCHEGCHSSFQVATNISDYECTKNKQDVSIKCLILSLPLRDIDRVSYTQFCVYDILKTHNLDFLSFYSALKNDLQLLPVSSGTDDPTPPETTPTKAATTTPSDIVSSVVIETSPSSQGVISGVPGLRSLSLSLLLLLLVVSLCFR